MWVKMAAAGVLAGLIATATIAEEPAVRRVHARFEAARPDAKSLAFYTLDWEMDLAAAKKRAQAEKRPILLILNTNITAGTNFFSGHT